MLGAEQDIPCKEEVVESIKYTLTAKVPPVDQRAYGKGSWLKDYQTDLSR